MDILALPAIFTLFLASAYDVLLPGHLTPLFVAILLSGQGKIKLLPMCIGMATGHATVMCGSIIIGATLAATLQSPTFGWYGILSRYVIYALTFAFGVYFLHAALRARSSCEAVQPYLQEKFAKLSYAHPFWLGIILGGVPCPATMGYAVIGMQLSAQLWYAITAVFAGMLVSLSLLGAAIYYVPRLITRLQRGLSGTPLFLIAAVVCFAYSVYGAWHFKTDFPHTWHRMWAWVHPIRAYENELRIFYTLDIGPEENASVQVIARDNDTYQIAFSFDFLAGKPPHFLPSLELHSPFATMTREEYRSLLVRLRDYFSSTVGTQWCPAHVYMARHISHVHDVTIATNMPADFLVSRMSESVRIISTLDAPQHTRERIQHAVGMSSATTELSRVEYETFLSRLHAFLTLTPIDRTSL